MSAKPLTAIRLDPKLKKAAKVVKDVEGTDFTALVHEGTEKEIKRRARRNPKLKKALEKAA